MFAVVDVETTGGYASGHNMTEIAVVITDGSRIHKEYSTLLNPQQSIPLNIQALTGITPDMVAGAPLFQDKAEEIRALLSDHIFVAHNVNFDYAFVKAAFAACGYDYNPKRLCSVRYTRKLESGLRSYSLKNLCRHFSIHNEAAHRAWGDARATTQLIHLLYGKDRDGLWQQLVKKNSGEFNLPAHLPSEEYKKLPEAPGVYYFLDSLGKPIYIGKAKNLKKRVATHFITNKETKRSQAFKREIHHIDYELTGSELLAILLEDHEIRHHWPRYNSAQKKPQKRFGVFSYQGQSGNWSLAVNRITVQKGYLAEFFTYNEALSWVYEQVVKYRLSPSRCGFPHTVVENTGEEDHNRNFEKMMNEMDMGISSFLIKTPGRTQDEDGFAYVENGRFAGIGFVPRETELLHTGEVLSYVRELRSSITTNGIISRVIAEGNYQTLSL